MRNPDGGQKNQEQQEQPEGDQKINEHRHVLALEDFTPPVNEESPAEQQCDQTPEQRTGSLT